jgi:transcriptional regulator with XRE-family HTH domain
MEPSELARRINTARAYAGIESWPELAEAIGEAGLSAANLGRIVRGEKTPTERDLKRIAEVCNVPTLWLIDESFDPMSFKIPERKPTESDVVIEKLDALTGTVDEGIGYLRQMQTDGTVQLAREIAQEVRKQLAQSREAPKRRKDTP